MSERWREGVLMHLRVRPDNLLFADIFEDLTGCEYNDKSKTLGVIAKRSNKKAGGIG